ncbi:MAG: winged helix-turn-helix domain-containing protein [Acidobacteria bacterium]|nr:winged helix-turn-helix domain-containing protein [Acidobacteriota bacterium]MBV9146665.1 winged helix-turn-helix domain-containing protein [Acidobacteriota bacterium]MBV9436495.1 winged helix-turn-helix domain-containing protein [Acidobacteriota bacterium]
MASVIRFENCEIDLSRFEVRRSGSKVPLEKQPFNLLVLLINRNGDVVSREDIVTELWGPDVFVETDRSINNAIRKIRLALKDDPEHPRFVETVAGRGYRFIAPLSASVAAPGTSVKDTGKNIAVLAVQGTRPTSGQYSRRRALIAAAALFAAAVVGLWVRSWVRSRPVTHSIGSIAVLPLKNLSADPGQEYFVDGMTDELTTELAHVGALKVISATSAMQYTGAKKSLPQIAHELNVEAVLEGSVLRDGQRVRITAQLIEAATDRHLWADSFEGDLKDALNLQRQVAQAIVEKVQARLSPDNRLQLMNRQEVDPVAHDFYLRGLYHYNKGIEKDFRDAIAYFQQAIAREPGYASAYAGIGNAYSQLSTYYVPPNDAMPKAKAAALKALAIDDNLAEAHAALGFVKVTYDWDWEGAAKEAQRALEQNPNLAAAHDVLALYLTARGRHDQAIASIQRAHQLDPYSIPIVADHIFLTFLARRYSESIEVGRRAVEDEPSAAMFHAYLALPYAMQGRFSEAIAEGEIGHRLDNSPLLESFLAGVYAVAGRKLDAERLVSDLKQKHESRYSCSYEIANTYVALGQADTAFGWFDTAYNERSDCMFALKVDPRLERIRTDARYQDLLRRVGL